MKSKTTDITLEPLFSALGLSEKESRLYRILLEIGEGTPSAITHKSGLKRGITYVLLYQMEKRGLITTFKKDKKTHFRLESPYKLKELINDKRKEVEQVEKSLETILPQLTSQYKMAIGKPTIRYFEGKEGLAEIFKDIYAPKEDTVYGAIEPSLIDQVFPGFSESELVPSRQKTKLQVKCLFSDTDFGKKLHGGDKEAYRESILVDKDKYPMPAEIEVYDHKVALLSFRKDDFLGLIIENEDIAILLKSVFRFLFDHLRECKDFREKGQ